MGVGSGVHCLSIFFWVLRVKSVQRPSLVCDHGLLPSPLRCSVVHLTDLSRWVHTCSLFLYYTSDIPKGHQKHKRGSVIKWVSIAFVPSPLPSLLIPDVFCFGLDLFCIYFLVFLKRVLMKCNMMLNFSCI